MSCVGFDLDMTLVDTRRGIHAALLGLAAETGRPIDADSVVAALGPPVAEALSPWFSAEELPDAVARFRVHMADVGVQDVTALPGAVDAVAAARETGNDVIVVTSKLQTLAVSTLDHAGLAADHVYGERWEAAKAEPLRAAGASAYVGDHPADMVAASHAGVVGIGVTSGSSSADELYAAGARLVLRELTGFRGWMSAPTLDATEVKVEDRLMTEAEARFVASWRYPAPYDTYETTEPEGWQKMRVQDPDGTGFYPIVAGDGLAGFMCFGAEGRVAGQSAEDGVCDVGMGLRPDALSLGIGTQALAEASRLALRFRAQRLRAAVLAWNDRSLQLCRSAGFVARGEVDNAEGRFVELVRPI